MWLTGQCGATFGLWLASPAEGCPGPRRGLGIGRRRQPGVADGWWACCVGGAGRDLGHVGSGLVQTGQAGGHFGMRRFAVGGLAGSGGCDGVVTGGAKHGGTEGDTLRRFLQVGGMVWTGWDG
jgi:hypothetical protein